MKAKNFMDIHHLNCGTLHAFGFPRKDDTGGVFTRGPGVIHCLLVDTGAGLVLVDTGWGARDCTLPSPRVRQFARFVGCPLDVKETAIRQIESRGYAPAAVKHIFLTHLHLDHAGGLPDFPAATVHLLTDELEAGLHPRTLRERWAYLPEQRAHGPQWQPHQPHGARWLGLDCAPPVRIGDAEFVLIPFPGHTRGHCGVAVRAGERWLLHCGDAYGYHRQVDPVQTYRHPSGRLLEFLVTTGFKMPRRNRNRIRELLRTHGDAIQAFCAHDAREFEVCRMGFR
ncbi:MAG: MBL fold metallo-hydrolase [Anaerolineae bacterium]|nr:MBL fold metallo-hydrolase [Anaerolineae bacterium]